MYRSISAVALLATFTLAGYLQNGVNANCAALGAVGGAAIGSATGGDLARSAIVGGIVGAIAGDQGACN